MRTVRPILFLTVDAPPLGAPLDRATALITENFGAVQENFLQVLAVTFALEPCLFYRSSKGSTGNLWVAYDELQSEGVIPRSFGGDVLYYVQVWHPQPFTETAVTGTQMTRPIGRCLDGAGPIEDFLGNRPDKRPINPANTMRNQARGRIRHELEHGLGGPHPELIFGTWWNYGLPGAIPGPSAARTAEVATLNKDWLVLK